MINISELTSEDIGKHVAHTTQWGLIQHGKIKSWNDTFVFVVYVCDDDWDEFMNYTGCATKPEELIFVIGG